MKKIKIIITIFISFIFIAVVYITIGQNIFASEQGWTCNSFPQCSGSHDCMQRPRGNVFCILIDCDGPGEHFQCGDN